MKSIALSAPIKRWNYIESHESYKPDNDALIKPYQI